MRQLQVSAPKKFHDRVEDLLENYSSDVESNEAEKDGEEMAEFTVTVDSEDVDAITEELKGIKQLDAGELSIRVLKQESLIEKGRETRGSSTRLSQEEMYSKAQEFSGFTDAQWGLIAVAAAIAGYGLALDNIIVVAGAMMLAPLLSPFISGAMSLAVGDARLMKSSLKAGTVSMFLTVIVAFLVMLPVPVEMNSTLKMIVAPGILTVVLSLLVGSAAALSFTSESRDQLVGVAVAIALVPPLAAAGLGLKMQAPVFAARAGAIALINILAVIVSGFMTFKLLGLKPSTYYKKKEASRLYYLVPAALLVLALVAVPLVYTSQTDHQGYLAQHSFRQTARDYFGEDLLSVDIDSGKAQVFVRGNYTGEKFKETVGSGIEVKLVNIPE